MRRAEIRILTLIENTRTLSGVGQAGLLGPLAQLRAQMDTGPDVDSVPMLV